MDMEKKPELIVICGPTAAGKTAVAVETAKRVGGVIISADSMQIYKELSIGTAKPTEEELDGVDCRLIDFVEPDGEYNVYRYKQDAEREIADVVSSGKVPILCGGTGLYIDVLTSNMELSAESNDETVRAELKKQAEEQGSTALHRQLEEVDKAAAERIHPNDTKRVIRALEIYRLTGRTQSEWDAASARESRYSLCKLLISCRDRAKLYDRIDRRVDAMMAAGLLEEAKRVFEKYDPEKISAIGYPELFAYFRGECELGDAVARIKQYSRNYAKRQLTWFRRGEYDAEYCTDERSVSDIAADAAGVFKEKYGIK